MIDQPNFSIFHRRPGTVSTQVPDAVAAPLREAPASAPALAPEAAGVAAEEPAAAVIAAPPEPPDAVPEPAPVSAPEPAAVSAAEPSAPAAAAEVAKPAPPPERAAPPFQQAELSTAGASADLLGLANPSVITLVASLPDEEPAALTSGPTGVYRAVGDTPPAATPPEAVAEREPAEALQAEALQAAALPAETGLARGTRILTAIGEIAVELLVLGDAALALRRPALLPIEWIGRTVAATRAIRFEAGALGRDIPRRALSLAPDHPVFIDPVPVPAHTLVNGSTIQAVEMEEAELFQIDVGEAEVLFAEGVPLSSHLREGL